MKKVKNTVKIKNDIFAAKSRSLLFIAGPCVIESEKICFEVADTIQRIKTKYNAEFVFKSSFDKANRTSSDSFRGPGLKKGLKILDKIKNKYGLPILTDIHIPEQAAFVADVADIIQIPAFLARQTDLVNAAADTQKVVNIKKAQFMTPHDIKYVVEKIQSRKNDKIIITERGTCFGYNNLVVDFKGFSVLKSFRKPLIFDATHSVQMPGGRKITKGNRKDIFPLAKAAAGCGVDGFFIEVHPDPKNARSDAANMLKLSDLEYFIDMVININKISKTFLKGL